MQAEQSTFLPTHCATDYSTIITAKQAELPAVLSAIAAAICAAYE
jgi:hypothetical protein